ncbi:TetR/AcrR family transcriptional regulator [Monashia sp. NPDC004114]
MTSVKVGEAQLDSSPETVAAQGSSAAGGTPRPMRADARRNYDKIVATARVVFTERGTDCSLDEIAKRAGVGPGTLYRHFPTREALVDALMRDWAERVTSDAQAAVAADRPARETLLTWFENFVEHITLHRGAAMKLCAAMDDPTSPIYGKCQIMGEANRMVIDHLDQRGELRPGVDPRNVMRLVSGIASVADQSRVPIDARPMLDVVIDGIVRD